MITLLLIKQVARRMTNYRVLFFFNSVTNQTPVYICKPISSFFIFMVTISAFVFTLNPKALFSESLCDNYKQTHPRHYLHRKIPTEEY